ncbi:hypothetical protein GWI33_018926 [Rhynchophorus ferrugineus]|uniref:Uncharacterized protein n=1 Tax=Rhynchophorus ferrugineus TaxID=354439 RepID=A0A834HTX4_RHYFE|nr:hypothetical protein GWI33_018926 [Rhynchophorus ferrugineus]
MSNEDSRRSGRPKEVTSESMCVCLESNQVKSDALISSRRRDARPTPQVPRASRRDHVSKLRDSASDVTGTFGKFMSALDCRDVRNSAKEVSEFSCYLKGILLN